MKPAPLRASAPRARVAGSRAAAGSSAGTRHLALKSSMRSADALCKLALGDLRTTPPPPEGKWGFRVARCAGEPHAETPSPLRGCWQAALKRRRAPADTPTVRTIVVVPVILSIGLAGCMTMTH